MPSKTLDEIAVIKNRHEKDWLALPGVTGVDIGSKANGGSAAVLCIRIFVANKASAPRAILALERIEGVPVKIIERSFELQ